MDAIELFAIGAAGFLGYKAYQIYRGPVIDSRDFRHLMVHWKESLQRTGCPCQVGKRKAYCVDIGRYETLTVDDLKQVLSEGFQFEAPSDSIKLNLIYKLCDKYKTALKAMKKDNVRQLLKINGVDAEDDLKKNDLILLALKVGF